MDRFFLGINRKAASPTYIFRRQALWLNIFETIVKSVCQAEKITGSGMKEFNITNELRETFESLLIETGHSDGSVSISTGHRDQNSLHSCQKILAPKALH